MVFAYLILFASIFGAFGDPIVSIGQGQLNGTILRSRGDKPFYAFYAIPYTKPPVGELRFAPPKKAPSWEGIRDASQKPPICLQPSTFTSKNVSFNGQEDCLYLSVFTPQIKPEKPLPVLVYIHGGAFRMGNGCGRGPHYFMDKRIVMVAMNHRHGIFGYLSSGDRIIPGNYGLKDQVAALKWVQSNIANFGGDPNSVTIMGQSSGAVCVHLHTLSSLSNGLFHRAIMESGSALVLWSHYNRHHSRHSFHEVVNRTSCQRNNTVEMLQCLRSLSSDQLMQVEQSFLSEKRIVLKFRPAIEKSKFKNAFIDTSPYDLQYKNTSIPWIIGFNSAEGLVDTILFFKNAGRGKKKITRELRKMMPYFLHYKYFTKNKLIPNITNALMQFYFENGTVSEHDAQRVCKLFTDITFGMPTLEAAYNYTGPRYLYHFDHQKDVSQQLKLFLNTTKLYDVKGAGHGDELQTLLSNHFDTNPTDADTKLSQQMIDYWSNFIITGNPNPPNDQLPRWDLFNPNSGNYLRIANDKITMGEQLLHDRYVFWKELMTKH